MVSCKIKEVKKILVLIGICSLWLGVSPARAGGDFYTSYTVSYTVNDKGLAWVEEKITLTNLTSRVYADQYQLTLPFKNVQNVSGTDSHGLLKIIAQDNQLTAYFNEQLAGKGKAYTFNLSYVVPIAIKKGEIWEVTLPKLGNPDIIDQYELTLALPESFGQPAYISPLPITSDARSYTFNRSQLLYSPVTATFGNFQSYQFQQKFHLENSGRRPTSQSITLPPDTYYQNVYLYSLTPQPDKIDVDPDGNWLASYKLKPKSAIDVTARGYVHVRSQPVRFTSSPALESFTSFLKTDKFWPTSDPQIQSLAQKLKTPKDIYDYVTTTLTYDPQRLVKSPARRGALSALTDPSHSLCTDFTDLFITIARAAGIPAREVNGFAATSDTQLLPLSLVADELHSWPQYWDEAAHTWVDVDPTWGNTSGGTDYFNKMDFNHIAFVIHGTSSTSPLSAGLYPNSKDSDIQVSLSPHVPLPLTPPEINWDPPWQIFPWSTKSRLHLTNRNSQAIYQFPVTISAPGIAEVSPTSLSISVLLPLSSSTYTLSLKSPIGPNFQTRSLIFNQGQNPITYNIPNHLFLVWHVTLAIFITAIIIALVWLTHQAWYLYLQRQVRKNSLRG
ncbi:MAG TPA: transglutaminase domain-containing protein [Patescibacteria group bacterium]|nr:transglutaminase domain-containing protein [Patescibacteria group bacterium]